MYARWGVVREDGATAGMLTFSSQVLALKSSSENISHNSFNKYDYNKLTSAKGNGENMQLEYHKNTFAHYTRSLYL